MKIKILPVVYLLKIKKIAISFKIYSVAFLLVALITISFNASANTYTVNTTADGTSSSGTVNLRGAIIAADALGGTQTINVPAGTYSLTQGEISFGNNAQNISIVGAGAGSTIINMTTTNQDRIFLINPPGTNSGVSTTISGITFQNGHLKSDAYGGGAIAAGGPTNSLTINNCIFTTNSLDINVNNQFGGGAIAFTFGGNLTITNTTFSGNSTPSTTSTNGGAIDYDVYSSGATYPNSILTITDCKFTNNLTNSGGQGGAIFINVRGTAGSPTISGNIARNTFTGNSAPSGQGGAIATSIGKSSNFTINYNRFYSNTASNANGLLLSNNSGTVDATNNWWGCNGGPSVCTDNAVASGAGTSTIAPYLLLTTTAATSPLCPGGTSAITSSFTVNSAGTTIATSNLSTLIGLPITFTATLGTISNQQTAIQSNGMATATYTAGSTTGAGTAVGTVDNGAASAAITVNATTSITTNPGTSTVCAGSTASLSVVATGTNLSYQWRIGTTNLANGATGTGSTISGVTTSTLSISNAGASDAGNTYNVVVSGTCGQVTSSNGTVVVNIPGTWTGATNSSWTTASNWACNAIPTSTTNVTIPVTSNSPVLTGNGTCNSITINASAALTLAANATLDIKGDLVNNGTYTANTTGATTSFSGSTQIVAGTTYYNLLLNGAGNKTLSGGAAVTNLLTLTAGMLSLGANNLTIGNLGSISGGSSNTYIITNSTGGLVQQNIGTSGRTGGIIFPVGASTASYTPTTLTNTGTADNYTISVLGSIYSSYDASGVPTGTAQSANAVGRTWLVKEGTAGGSNVTLAFQWSGTDELQSFNRAACYVSHFYAGLWHPSNTSAATSVNNVYTQTISGVNAFSPFGVGSASSILPLNLLTFTGTTNGTLNLLSWTTSSEKNSSNFIVERSTNSVDFDSITNVLATGNNNTGINTYHYTDATGTAATYFYRLKMVDKDGTSTYSSILSVSTLATESYMVKVTPNPFQSQVSINVNAPQDGNLTFEIVDISGKKLMTQTVAVMQGSNIIAVNQFANFAHGTYLLHVFNSTINQTIKLVKVK